MVKSFLNCRHYQLLLVRCLAYIYRIILGSLKLINVNGEPLRLDLGHLSELKVVSLDSMSDATLDFTTGVRELRVLRLVLFAVRSGGRSVYSDPFAARCQ